MTEKEIYKKMKLAIVQRKLPPRTQLVEDVLADSFKVSRTLIRGALRRLAYEKLVTLIAYKGAFVSCPSVEEAKEVFEMRRILERSAIRQACDKITPQKVKELKAIIELENTADSVPATLESSGNLHLKIAEAAGNSYYLKYLEELISLTYVIIALYSTEAPANHEDHVAILSAMVDGDKDRAEQLMVSHLTNIEQSLDFRTTFTPVASFSDIFAETGNQSEP